MSRRFSSLSHAPAKTREHLRDRLSRYLPSSGHTPIVRRSGTVTLPDEVLLDLLLHLDVAFASDEERARASYAASLPENSNEPSLDTLIEDRWLRVIWGRISTSFEVSRAIQAPGVTLTALKTLLNGRFDQTFRIADEARGRTVLHSTVAAIERREILPDAIGSQSPEWVAARLWDRAQRDSADKTAALRLWVDRWHVLGSPPLIPAAAWSDADAAAFWEAVVETLESKAGLFSWEEMRSSFTAWMAVVGGRPPSDPCIRLPFVPSTLIDRALWLDGNGIQRAVIGTLDGCRSVSGLVQLLLNEIEAADHAPAPHPHATKLLDIATERAELFVILLFRLRVSPKLLADVLLNPATSALACLVVGQWHSSGGAWDRELTDRDDEATKAIAFGDAVSVMGWYLKQGSLPPAEAAALLKWVHSKGKTSFIDDEGRTEPMLSALRAELVGQSSEILRAMAAALAATMPQSGVGTPEFAASVDIVDMGKLTGSVDPGPLIAAYTQSIAAGAYSLAANRIT